MIKKNITKLVIAVVLTLTVTVGFGVSDIMLDTGLTTHASASCLGGGSSGGGGGGC